MALALAPLSGQQSSAQLPSLNDLNYSQQHTSSSSYNPYQNQAYSVGPSSSSSSSAAPQYTMPREPKTHHGQHHDPYPVSYAQSQQMPPPPMHHLSQHHQQPQQGQQQQHPPQQQVNGYGQQNGPQHVQNGSASNHPSPIASPAIQTQPLSRPDSGPASPPESVSPQSPQAPNSQPNGAPSTSVTSAPSASGGGKKKHVCPTCDRAFTTSGHLARHTRVHTGERNHKCPFPGCETRCSRQDNLQQHYRIHLSPGSRRSNSSATRAAIQRAMSNPSNPPSLASAAASLVSPPPPPNAPPPLAHAHAPSAPPPLAHAYPSGESRVSAERSPDLRYTSYVPPQSTAYASPPPLAPATNASGQPNVNGPGQPHNHSPGHSATASPVMGHGHGHVYAHGQTGYTFAPQPQVPILQGPAANTTVYAPAYGSQPPQPSSQYHQPYPPQAQPSNMQRSNSTSSHRGQGASHSGSPSPTHSPHQQTQGMVDPSANGGQSGNPYPPMGPPSNGHPNGANGNGSTSSTPGSGGHGLHQYSNGATSYTFQMQHAPPPPGNRYSNASPPPILAPIRKDSGAMPAGQGAPGNPYPQVAKGYAT